MENSTIATIILCIMLSGCSALSGVSVLSSVASGVSSLSVPKGGIHAQIGDKTTEVAQGATVGKTSKAEVVTNVGPIVAQREVKVDQSTQKEDKKTEIGEVTGEVTVIQGPTGGTMAFLYSGWIGLAVIPLVALLWLLRKRRSLP